MPGKQAKVITSPMLKRMLRRVSRSSHPARDRAMIAKKRGGRRIPMHPDLRRALERLAQSTETVRPMIRSYRGSNFKASSVVNWFAALFKELGFQGCSSHSGRRTFITGAARNVHRSGLQPARRPAARGAPVHRDDRALHRRRHLRAAAAGRPAVTPCPSSDAPTPPVTPQNQGPHSHARL